MAQEVCPICYELVSPGAMRLHQSTDHCRAAAKLKREQMRSAVAFKAEHEVKRKEAKAIEVESRKRPVYLASAPERMGEYAAFRSALLVREGNACETIVWVEAATEAACKRLSNRVLSVWKTGGVPRGTYTGSKIVERVEENALRQVRIVKLTGPVAKQGSFRKGERVGRTECVIGLGKAGLSKKTDKTSAEYRALVSALAFEVWYAVPKGVRR